MALEKNQVPTFCTDIDCLLILESSCCRELTLCITVGEDGSEGGPAAGTVGGPEGDLGLSSGMIRTFVFIRSLMPGP